MLFYENLIRSELTVLQQSQHIKRREELLEAMGLRAKASPGTNQYTDNSEPTLPIEVVGVTVTPTKTTEDLAHEAGLSKNSLQKRKQIANNITPGIISYLDTIIKEISKVGKIWNYHRKNIT